MSPAKRRRVEAEHWRVHESGGVDAHALAAASENEGDLRDRDEASEDEAADQGMRVDVRDAPLNVEGTQDRDLLRPLTYALALGPIALVTNLSLVAMQTGFLPEELVVVRDC